VKRGAGKGVCKASEERNPSSFKGSFRLGTATQKLPTVSKSRIGGGGVRRREGVEPAETKHGGSKSRKLHLKKKSKKDRRVGKNDRERRDSTTGRKRGVRKSQGSDQEGTGFRKEPEP